MRKKSGVGNGEGSVGNGESGVCNLSSSFSVAHTGNARIWNTQCPMRWDKTSHPLGQPASTGVTFHYTLSKRSITPRKANTRIIVLLQTYYLL